MKISMKKYILSSCLIVSTTLASENNNLYAKVGTGLNQINPIVIQTNDLNGKFCSEENSSNAFGDAFKVSYKTKISTLMFNWIQGYSPNPSVAAICDSL